MKEICIVLILLFCSSIVKSQNYIDLFKLDYSISPGSTFDNSENGNTLNEINGDLTIPVAINDSFALLTGVVYENISASFASGRSEESFTGLTLKLGASIKHNSKWSGSYIFLPKISSDFRTISNRDFQLGGAVLLNFIKSDQLIYKFGVYGNKEQFGAFIVPLFGFYYLNSSQKFEMKVLLPLALDLNYLVAKDFRVGLNFKGEIRSYNINIPFGAEKDRYLVKGARDLYTYCQYGTNNGVNFRLGIGRSIGRLYRIYDEKVTLAVPLFYFGDNRKQLNTDFSDSWLYKVSVFYRFSIGENTAKGKI